MSLTLEATFASKLRNMLKSLQIIVLVLGVHMAFANGNGSSFKGKVTDKNTGETLVGAKVLVVETGHVVYTDFDGNFFLTDLDAGTYTFEISYLGYEDLISRKVEIKNKCIAPCEFNLSAK